MLAAAMMAVALGADTPPPAGLSLVLARCGTQGDPVPAPCGPNGACGDFHYRSTFDQTRTLAGTPLPAAFEARLKLHTPYISRYTLALIVERRPDGSLLILRRAGFNGRTGIACFQEPDEFPVDWTPAAPDIVAQGKSLCVSDPTQIDPNAPPS